MTDDTEADGLAWDHGCPRVGCVSGQRGLFREETDADGGSPKGLGVKEKVLLPPHRPEADKRQAPGICNVTVGSTFGDRSDLNGPLKAQEACPAPPELSVAPQGRLAAGERGAAWVCGPLRRLPEHRSPRRAECKAGLT